MRVRSRLTAGSYCAPMTLTPEQQDMYQREVAAHEEGDWGKVVTAWIHPGHVDATFAHAMVEAARFDAINARVLVGEGSGSINLESGPRITESRSTVVATFLSDPAFTKARWLWMIDADMGFDRDALYRLLAAAHPIKRPIVGGLCFAGGRSERIFPTIYRLVPDTGAGVHVEPIPDYPRDTLLQVGATGAAFMLVHKSVLMHMAEAFKTLPDGSPNPYPWFSESVHRGRPIGEDIAFCMRAQQLGYPVFVHTGVATTHAKRHLLDEARYDAHRAAQADVVKPDVPTYVVVPVKDRLDLTRNLLEQLYRDRNYEHIIVLDNGSALQNRAYLEVDEALGRISLVDAEGWDLHVMWNKGWAMARDHFRLNHSDGHAYHVAFLNNDLHLGGDMLFHLSDALAAADPSIWAMSPVYDDREIADIEVVSGIAAAGGLAGFCFMVRGHVLDDAGIAFDERFVWWFGDNDLVAQIEAKGGKVAITGMATVEHIGGGSQTVAVTEEWYQSSTKKHKGPQRKPTATFKKVIAKDQAAFYEKWGIKPDAD